MFLSNILAVVIGMGVYVATLVSGNAVQKPDIVSNQVCPLQPPAPTTCLQVANVDVVNPYILEEMSKNRNNPTHCPASSADDRFYYPYYFGCSSKDLECASSALLEGYRHVKVGSHSLAIFYDERYSDYTLRTFKPHDPEKTKSFHDADRLALNQTFSEQCRIAGEPFKWNKNFHDHFHKGVFVKGLYL